MYVIILIGDNRGNRDNNEGSKKTIEKCLGVQDESVPSRYPNIMELRYWVPVKQKENKLS